MLPGFRPARSTLSHVLALRVIAVKVPCHKKVALIIFIAFKKAFDSVYRKKMLKIPLAYGIPPENGNAIRVIYENTLALVMTPEGKTNVLLIDTGVLQGDPLAPFLFVIRLDYALRSAIDTSAVSTLKKKG